MVNLTRKQREVLQREELILEITRDILLDRGYHGLTMDRVAEAVEYSKGTVYQHFGCKEEVLTELAIRIHEKREQLFKRAATFSGRARERMVAIGEASQLFMLLYPDDMRLLQIINTEIITAKVSQARQERMRTLEYSTLNVMIDIVREGIGQGDLVLNEGVKPEELPFGLWALTDGGYAKILRGISMEEIGITQPFETIIKSCDVLGDGYGWQPLSTEWDYAQTRKIIHETIFADEAKLLATRNS